MEHISKFGSDFPPGFAAQEFIKCRVDQQTPGHGQIEGPSVFQGVFVVGYEP